MSLLPKVLSLKEKQFRGHEGKGAYPLTCDSVLSSISQVRSFRGYDPSRDAGVPRLAQAGYKISTACPRAQAPATPGSARAPSSTEPGPGHTRKTHSYIMMGKTVAAVLTLLLISALGTQGKETLPQVLLMARANVGGETLCSFTSAAKDSPNAVSQKPHVVLPVKIANHSTFCF